MGNPPDGNHGPPGERGASASRGFGNRIRRTIATGSERATSAAEHHASVAIPFRAADRNRRVAASVLAGGFAYRLFLWLLAFGLVVGGALGLGDADGTEQAVASGGLPAAVVNVIGDVARAADSNSWWLLAIGVPTLLWEGYAGAKGLDRVHALVWNDPSPPRIRALKSSLAFSGGMCVFIAAVCLSWWFRDTSAAAQWLIFAMMIVPLAAVWLLASLRLPHGSASWTSLLPGAFLVAVGFQVVHGLVLYFLAAKLEKSTSLYAALGVTTTLLFVGWVVGWLVVTSPILNSSLHEDRQERAGHEDAKLTVEAGST